MPFLVAFVPAELGKSDAQPRVLAFARNLEAAVDMVHACAVEVVRQESGDARAASASEVPAQTGCFLVEEHRGCVRVDRMDLLVQPAGWVFGAFLQRERSVTGRVCAVEFDCDALHPLSALASIDPLGAARPPPAALPARQSGPARHAARPPAPFMNELQRLLGSKSKQA